MTIHEVGDLTLLGRRVPAAEMSRAAVLTRWAIGLSGLLLLPAIVLARPPITLRYFVLFAGLMLVAEIFFTVRVGPGAFFTPSTTFLLVFFLLTGGVGAAMLDATVRVGAWAWQRLRREAAGQTPLYAFFNIGQHVISALIASVVVGLIFDKPSMRFPIAVHPRSSIVLFAFAYLVVNVGLIVLAGATRTSMAEVRTHLFPTTILWSTISVVTAIPFAIVITLLAQSIRYTTASLVVLLFLAAICWILKLNVNLRQGNDELKAVNRIGNLVNATLDLSQLFSIIARESVKVVPWDAFFIAIAEKGSPTIQIIFMAKGGREITQRTIPRGAGLTGRAIETGEMIVYQRDKEQEVATDDTLRGNKKPRSIVVAPMKFNDEVIGAISVQSFHTYAYNPSQLGVLQTIAAQAAIAVRNAQLFRSEELAREERDEFFSLVTHEIKNPLTSVKGYADIAAMEIEAGNYEGAIDAVNVIRTEAGRILRLAEDLLDASRMGAGKFSIRLEDVELGHIVSEIAQKYRDTSAHPIELQIADGLPHIKGDAVRLGQVAENLISNAVKYSPDGAPITVALRQSGPRIFLSVKDRGLGIPEHKRSLIFERFYRVHEGAAEVKGTGLGLFVTREIVERHGGTIRVESAEGEGSVFIVDLPVNGPGT